MDIPGMSHGPIALWIRMDSGTHASVRGTGEHPRNVPWDLGIGLKYDTHSSARGTGGHSMESPIVPWDGQ